MQKRPNILFLMSDQHRADLTGYAGSPVVRTPEDQPAICGTATLKEVREHGYVLTPGRYVGTSAAEDDGILSMGKTAELTVALYEQIAESIQLDDAIRANMEALGYGE